jgi:hypothetical protein
MLRIAAIMEMESGMKRNLVFSVLVVLVVTATSFGQELNTVALCRAYREAWIASADSDVKHLSIKELVHRADQMMTCGKQIDGRPLTAEMTQDDALKTMIENLGYATLSSAYYDEAFHRAAWFIDSKTLMREFLTADGKAESLSKTSNDISPDFVPAVAPDNGKPWDEYWGCSEAQRLSPMCKQSKIELNQAQASAGGRTPVGPLPTLVRPPKGYELNPSAETCRIMYRWDYYCRNSGMSK